MEQITRYKTVLTKSLSLLFVLSTAFAIYGISHYRQNGSMPAYATKAPEAIPSEDQAEDYVFSSNPHDRLDRQQEMQPMHQDDDTVSSLHHTDLEAANQEEEDPNWHRHPTPDISRAWDERSTHDVAMGEGWNRRRTPDLPVGDSYYPVDTSYHGGRQSPYDPPQHHRPSSSLGGRTPSPQYHTYHSNESDFVGGLKPRPVQTPRPIRSGAGDPFRDDLESSHDSIQPIEFPNAGYGRLGP